MKVINICPRCGLPGIKVNEKAVMHNLKKVKSGDRNKNLKWSACLNPDCECSYFSGKKSFTVADLVKPLFYKDETENVPICYYSGLTRGEIKNAVKKGCNSINEVQKFTGKNMTGHCKKRNPLGKCCREVFLKTIKG